MGWFSGKSSSHEVDAALAALESAKNRRERDKVMGQIKSGKFGLSAKEVKQMQQVEKRATEGERGFGALAAGMKGGGSKNYQNIPLKDRVHPSEYKRILDREARRQGLL